MTGGITRSTTPRWRLRQFQRPHPPIYIAATRTQATLEFVVSTGHLLIIGVVLDTVDTLDLCRQFVKMSEESGHSAPMSDIPFFRYFYVAETEEQARIDAKVALDWNLDMIGWRATFTEGSEVGLNLADWRGASGYTPPDFDHLYDQRAVMGTPEQVVSR